MDIIIVKPDCVPFIPLLEFEMLFLSVSILQSVVSTNLPPYLFSSSSFHNNNGAIYHRLFVCFRVVHRSGQLEGRIGSGQKFWIVILFISLYLCLLWPTSCSITISEDITTLILKHMPVKWRIQSCESGADGTNWVTTFFSKATSDRVSIFSHAVPSKSGLLAIRRGLFCCFCFICFCCLRILAPRHYPQRHSSLFLGSAV